MQRSEITGTMRDTPSSTAFSIVQSQREPLVTQANSVKSRRDDVETPRG